MLESKDLEIEKLKIQVRSKDEENKSNFQYKEEKHDKMKKE
jgi:hypothetical protein